MADVPKELLDIAERLRCDERPNPSSVKTLLSWFGDIRRGKVVVAKIRAALLTAGLVTEPDFHAGGYDDHIVFRLADKTTMISQKTAESSAAKYLSVSAQLQEIGTTSPHTYLDEPSDDFLEPEIDEEQTEQVDDRPVTATPSDWTITTLREKWDAGLLDLQPEFQREYVWSSKPELPSRLIESVLLEIPIPPLYFGRLDGGRLEVIDGQQRLTTLINFINNKFSLKRLTRMPSLNGKTFRDLNIDNQEKIKDTPIRTVTINASRNTELRYEIFERLTRGSMGLNEQELRNCVYRGRFNLLLAELESDKYWRLVKGGNEPEPRFKEREMILRFLAFAYRRDFYKGALKRFLNEYMARHAHVDESGILEQQHTFQQTMRNIYTVFGANAGRLYNIHHGNDGSWDKKFSIAALEIQASALLGQDHAKVQKVADQIYEPYLLLLLTDDAMRNTISQSTSGRIATRLRWTRFKSVIDPMLDGVSIEPRFFSSQFRKHLYDKSQSCSICRNKIHNIDDSTVDHIIPYSKGGKTVDSNGQLAHRSCNSKKNANVVADAPANLSGAKGK